MSSSPPAVLPPAKTISIDFASMMFAAMDAIEAKNPIYNRDATQEVLSDKDEDKALFAISLREKAIRAKSQAIISGAAALPEPLIPLLPEDVDNNRYWHMNDPYVSDTRRKFEDAVFQVQPLHKGLENRSNAFFRKGFHFEVELKSRRDEKGAMLDESQQETASKAAVGKYQQYLLQLETWAYSQNINLKDVMDSANIMSFVQGRSLSLITPPISQLAPQELPLSVNTLSWEDTGEPIVDKYYWTLAACRIVNMTDKQIAMRDEMVYFTRKSWSLRKWSRFYGSSMIEAAVQSARTYKKLVDYDFAKAIVAGYMTKLFITMQGLQGLDATTRDQRLAEVVSSIMQNGVDVVALESGFDIKSEGVKVDTAMIIQLYEKLFELLSSATGSTKSQMGITDGLTRDNATIQEIVFMKYVREVDEALVKDAFETQLLTPLLAHLAGEDVDKMPVQVIIVSDDEELDSLSQDPQGPANAPEQQQQQQQDPNMQNKMQDMQDAAKAPNDAQAVKQADAKEKTFGASGGKSLQERDVEATESLVELLRQEIESRKKEIG